MELKGSGSMQIKVLNGLVYEICEIYFDDLFIHGKSEAEILHNVRRVFERLRAKNVAVNPKKIKLGLPEVEYVGHLVSATGTSFTPEKRLKVLDFPPPTTQKELLPRSCSKHDRNGETLARHDTSRQIPEDLQAYLGNRELCSELYFLEDTATPILQTDAFDYGIGGYLSMVTNGKVRVIRFFSKALTGA